MKKFKRVYVEITNICNLNCSFCPKNTRQKTLMSTENFKYIINQISPLTDSICLHLMGEPLMHPNLEQILQIATDNHLNINLTTNGTLLKQNTSLLLKGQCRKISISLHSYQANKQLLSLEQYLNDILQTCTQIINNTNTIIEFRLWNNGANNNNLNNKIIEIICSYFNSKIVVSDNQKNYTITDNVFLGFENKFDWPITTQTTEQNSCKFCYGLRTHFGILCDGTVVPCCLDSEGKIALGNIFKQDINEILSCKRAQNIYNGFTNRNITEKFCQTCTYAKRFDK